MTSLRVTVDADTVRRVLGERYFEPGWETSYYYREEVLNLRRVVYTDADRYPWRQVHVRGFEVDGGLELDPHRETEPLQYPEAHRREDPLSVEAGVEVVAGLLEEAGLDYEVVPADGRASPETGQD